ncbi:MAG: cell envelope biosis protein TolA [Tardiphaga sp.]|jgi:colicin import membrane protein|uniref:cell envelope biogenesis protein TolA n=1 Tax=Tardiphaga sp. TaxID=1926292 RepID=UPI002622BAC4|nr:cell envelope biogenesis protein TolA [Tardiphaga sp.]MDB5501495.1 cell envelope biosis protein TolA [Tardiphaga sp.]
MTRALKTYRTSIGFFDMAVAVPSMKAALEAWGANSNLFHQGFARQVDDADVVAATMKRPGVVLRRPVGTTGPFKEQADLPADLASPPKSSKATKSDAKPRRPTGKVGAKRAQETKAAAVVFEREERTRAGARRKEEAAEAKERNRREAAVAKAQEALREAERSHASNVAAIDTERDDIEQRAREEDERWERARAKLESAVRKAKSSG